MKCHLLTPALFSLVTVLAPVQAQDYPTKTVRLIVPWAAGGSTDSVGRIVGQKLAEQTGQQWIIDNRGAPPAPSATRWPPNRRLNGYTLLLGTNSTFAIAPHLYKKIQYDNETAFAPISLVAVNRKSLPCTPRYR